MTKGFVLGLVIGLLIFPPLVGKTFNGEMSPTFPTGTILIVASGTCPLGFTEFSAGDGRALLGTLAAHGDIGTTGGTDSITPTVASTGLTAAAQTPNSLTAAAQTPNNLTAAAQGISGSTAAEASHTHGVGTFANGAITMSGSTAAEASHNHSVTSNVSQNVFTNPTIAWPVNPPTNGAIAIGTFVNVATATTGNSAATNIAAGTGSLTAAKATAPNLTVPAEGHSGALTPPTISYPANVPTASGGSVTLNNPAVTSAAGSSHLHAIGTIAASTPSFTGTSAAGSSHLHGAGTLANSTSAVTGTMNSSAVTGTMNSSSVTGTITLNAFDPKGPWVRVIYCIKT